MTLNALKFCSKIKQTKKPNEPSNLTIKGTWSLILLQAFVIPFAIMAQFTIPPKMLTKTALTWKKKENLTKYTKVTELLTEKHIN